MTNKPEEQTPDSRELTTEELEAVAGGMFIAAGVAALHVRQKQEYQAKCRKDPMSCP